MERAVHCTKRRKVQRVTKWLIVRPYLVEVSKCVYMLKKEKLANDHRLKTVGNKQSNKFLIYRPNRTILSQSNSNGCRHHEVKMFVTILLFGRHCLTLLLSRSHCLCVLKRNNSDKVTPKAFAIAAIFLSDGFRSPRSIPPRYVRCKPDLNASTSCDNPVVSRSCLTLLPNCFCINFIFDLGWIL
jgi:hypothetical protein